MNSYRLSKSQFYEQETSCPIADAAIFQLEALNMRFGEIARQLIDRQDIVCFEPDRRIQAQAIYDLGTISDYDVMTRLMTLEGYRALHDSLKSINADFRFQILPSAGMVRPKPVLMLIVENFRSYAANMTTKNRHMYPDFTANDNGAAAGGMRFLFS